MGKSLSSDSARVVRRSSKKKHRDVQRRTRGSASLPAPAKKLGPIISTVHTNDSTLTRNKGLLVSLLLELFLDRSEKVGGIVEGIGSHLSCLLLLLRFDPNDPFVRCPTMSKAKHWRRVCDAADH